MKSEYVGS